MSKLEVDAVEPQSGTSLTIGASGDTITIPSGAIISNQGTATGFGPTGAVSWDVANVKTSGFTAVNGFGYFCNTTSSAFTVTLPASPSAGNVVGICDYAGTFGTNNLTVGRNGSKISGISSNATMSTNGIAITLVYVDSTQGWIVTDSGDRADAPQTYSIDFLVVAGGASGGRANSGGDCAGGGGAGGYRTSTQTVSAGTVITVTVGDGGASVASANLIGNAGSDSSISGSGLTTITSAGGGAGGRTLAGNNGGNGGSGGGSGGGGFNMLGGNGNTPSTAPSQGNKGGDGLTSGPSDSPSAGGGGAGASGANAQTGISGNGGAGTASSITGSSVTRAGGGGGCSSFTGSPSGTAGSGGTGGGGAGSTTSGNGTNGTANTGGGGGGSNSATSGAGGKGVVILSVPDANYSGTTTGSPTVATGVSGKTVLTFTGTGSYTT